MYSVVINDFSAVDYSTEHSAYIVNFGSQASHTMKFSINSYLTSRVLNSSEHSNFYKAAYLYGKAAAAVRLKLKLKNQLVKKMVMFKKCMAIIFMKKLLIVN